MTLEARAALVARLRDVQNNDWRIAHLAHTSDTAGEAADQIEADGKRLAELEGQLRDTIVAVTSADGEYGP